MAQTTLNVRMDADVKKALEEFCSAVGMNTSIAVNMFAKAVLREQRLPFDVVANMPNSETLAALNNTVNGIDMHGPFDSVEALMEDLNA